MAVNKKSLLVIVALLLGVKFGLLPLFSFQNTLSMELEGVQNRYMKSITVVEGQSQFKAQIAQYENQLASLSSQFGSPVNVQSFTLDYQENFKKELELRELRLVRFGFSQQFEEVAGDIQQAKIKVTFAGETAQLLSMLLKIKSLNGMTVIDNYNFSVRGAQTQELQIGRGQLSVDFSLWVKAL